MTDQTDAASTERLQVLALLQARRHADALAALQGYCPRHPEDGEAWSWLGMLQTKSGNLQEAESAFRHVLQLDPESPGAHNDLGHVLHMQGRLDAAVEQFQHAQALQSVFPAAAYNLALVYTRQGRVKDAMDAYRKSLHDRPDFPEAHNNLANLMRNQGLSAEAILHYRKAVEARPDFADAHANLAVTLENLHRLEEASSAARQALAIVPDHPVASIVLAQIDRREGNLASARERLERLQGLPGIPPVQAAAIEMELGHVLDRLGETDAAFAAFSRGNAIWKQLLGSERANDKGYARRVEQALSLFTEARIANWSGAVIEDDLPSPVFLVGFPRSGTTLTEEILGAHSGVITSHEQPVLLRLIQETPAVIGRDFNYPADLDTLSDNDIGQLRARYWVLASDMVGATVREKRFIDKLPLNLVDLALVRRLFPESRVIQLLRDPRDACLSCYMQAFQPNQAMTQFLDLASTVQMCGNVMKLAEHYRTVLGLPWTVLRYEDVVRETETTVRGLLGFLDLEWDPAVLRYYESAQTRYANTPSYQDVTSPLYERAIGRWRNYREYLAPYLEALHQVVNKYGYEP
jgi:Flp pilus assembly protein TadD